MEQSSWAMIADASYLRNLYLMVKPLMELEQDLVSSNVLINE